uniref:Ig-like domain-containing protein n=1 Tax=Lates calcarifer TaxID=8187 RepID=A0A4W6F945_LATCA
SCFIWNVWLTYFRCGNDHIFETKTVDVGDDVTLTCPRKTTWLASDLFWIRLVPGTFPEALGGMIAYNFDRVKKTNHMTAKQEPGLFVLHFSKTRLSDTAVYYCIKVEQRNMTFLKGIFLRIKGNKPDITAVTQDFLSDPVRPGDSVTLQCSVLSDSEKKTCLEDHHVYWFRARSDKSHPSLIYAHRNHSDTCEEGPEKCVYNFSKIIRSSDSGTYYCAVATCGEIIFGNGTKLDIEGKCGTFLYNGTISILCVCFRVCFFASLSSSIFSQRHGDMSVYSAVVFTIMKADGGAIKDEKAAETERIYAAVKAFGLGH